MSRKKYIGMDVHKAAISVAVRDATGKLTMESTIETKAATILELVHGLGANLSVTFEEGTGASWLYDLLKPHVAELIVCDPRKNALLRGGSKNDKVDARKLSELLRAGLLSPVYHGDRGSRTVKEFARSYLTITKDQTQLSGAFLNRSGTRRNRPALPLRGLIRCPEIFRNVIMNCLVREDYLPDARRPLCTTRAACCPRRR